MGTSCRKVSPYLPVRYGAAPNAPYMLDSGVHRNDGLVKSRHTGENRCPVFL